MLGGWLGSGKTTLLNRLLASGSAGRIAVIVNDVGDINIDARLIARHDGETVELTDGCICCSIGDSLALTLRDLVVQPRPPEGLVIEASGIADPLKVAAYGDRRRVRCDVIAVTVDATAVRQQASHSTYGPLVAQQVAAADVLLLTKTDLSPADPATEWCREIAPTTPIVDAQQQPAVALAALTPNSTVSGETRPRRNAEPTPIPLLTTHTWQLGNAALTTTELRAHLEAASEHELVRAKGVVLTVDGPMLVQLAGNRVSIGATELGATGLVTIWAAPPPLAILRNLQNPSTAEITDIQNFPHRE